MAEEKRPVRRLTVFKPTEEDGEPPRPPWQWVGFGAAAIFGAWLPLAYVAEALKARLLRARVGDVRSPEEAALALKELPSRELLTLNVLVVVLMVLPLALASFAGGFLVGRYGQGAGIREAALAGFATALLASGLSFAEGGFSFAPLVAFAVAVGLAAWGGRVGKRVRARTHGPGA